MNSFETPISQHCYINLFNKKISSWYPPYETIHIEDKQLQSEFT
ncbi:hypothetical protein EV10_1542 [Prochlorococcus marinus str. SS51]|nr:hypothetical protein EV04_0475 [Prochlorococcus marinus str. LG]KGG23337.1 hypothetical protein EV09_0961 [Prochlorococcus marinus str. SS35]KGG32427.1 hypothetical protein EV10_1542 [Prochlorococcus marinus str. SS51]